MALNEEPKEPLYSETPAVKEEAALAATDPWSSYVALKRVTRNFDEAENYRRLNHDWRWQNADELYLGWMQQRFWEGTKIPRSSLPVYLTFEHIESAIPQDTIALFGEPMWFDARPYPGTTPQEARAVQELLLAQLRHVNQGTGVREVFRKADKSARVYGNGIIYQGWRRAREKRIVTVDETVPVTIPFNIPGAGTFNVPTGKTRRVIKHVPTEQQVNEPVLEYVSLRDFYIDPHTPDPFPWNASYAIRRKLVTVKALLALRDEPGFSIPNTGQLLGLAQEKVHASADEARHIGEAMRDGSYHPLSDYAVSGEDKRVEMLEYWTADRLVWVLGRKHVAYNVPNPYGWIPFLNVWFADVLDRFYALGQSDILEPEQRLQQSIINARVDELSLMIHPPAKKRRGIPIAQSQLRRRPGVITEMEDPETDVIWEQPRNVTSQAFVEVAASEARAQRRDGITELAILGTPGQGTSINRTATGIQTQSTAARFRIGHFIENIQDSVIVPMLDRFLELNQRFNTQEEVVKILGVEGQAIALDSSALLRANLKFEMRAANKMNSRPAMLAVLPLVVQTLLNPEIMRRLNAEGKTVEIEEIINMVLDATNYRPHKISLIRALTPQEQQALSLAAIDQTKIMTQQIRGANQLEVTQEKESAGIVRELMAKMMESRGQEAEEAQA